MKKIFILSLTLLLMISTVLGITFATTPNSQSAYAKADDVSSICVIGEACQEVSPDRATITACIETMSQDITKAKDENMQLFNDCVNALIDCGIQKDSIITECFSAYPSYDYSNCRTLTGYYATTTFSFKVNSLENIKPCIDAVTTHGAISIRNINYEISNQEEVYSQTLLTCLENAKQKASQLSGQDIDSLQLLSINEEYVYTSSSLYRNYNDGMIDNDMVGKVTICARLKVEFALN